MWTKDALVALATEDAESRGLNANHFRAVINRESGWSTDIQSAYPDSSDPSGHEPSFGIAQINLPANASTTLKMADDPVYALGFMADRWKEGLAGHWTQYRLLEARYGDGAWPE